MEDVDFLIIGGGIAGITLKHFLKNDRTVLLESEPGRYKIGESIIPEHFRHPDLRALLPRLQQMPSFSPKYGTTFIENGSVASFPLPEETAEIAMHITRTDMEKVMLDAWGVEPRVERVTGVDLASRTVRTDVGEYRVARQIIDCSGPAMVLSTLLHQTRKLWPVYSTWAYWDIESNDPGRFHETVQANGWSNLSFSYAHRRVLPEQNRDWRPGRSTVLTKIADGMWSWQIPLHREKLLSYGIVSRHGPISREQYEEIARSRTAPNYTLKMRPVDGSGPYNKLHVRNNFARMAEKAATDRTILVSDAFAFADPVYSVGTGLAVNKAIEVAAILNETEWTPAICAAYCERYEKLIESAISGFEFWYAGKVLTDDLAASKVQEELLVGNYFQSNIVWHYVHALSSADLPPRLYDADPFAIDWQDPGLEKATANVTAAARVLLGAKADKAAHDFRFIRARPAKNGIVMKWTRSSNSDLLLLLSHARPGASYVRRFDSLGVSYFSSHEDTHSSLARDARVLVDDLAPMFVRRKADWSDVLNTVSAPALAEGSLRVGRMPQPDGHLIGYVTA